ncbi:MAG TPA: molybdenum cofactor guanylyltransferase [Dehalococcoidales bacterium]
MKTTAIILCGGKNLRLGRNKALEVIGGKTLIERVMERLRPLASQILVVTSKEKFSLPATDQAEILVDIYPEKGPLGGIYTALIAARFTPSIVAACDMPFLSTELLGYMLELSPGFDAVVPRLAHGMVEPLHAIYAKNCLPKIKARLENNQLAITPLLKELRVRYVEKAECRRFDPTLLSFFNINYPSDLEEANRLLSQSLTARPKPPGERIS